MGAGKFRIYAYGLFIGRYHPVIFFLLEIVEAELVLGVQVVRVYLYDKLVILHRPVGVAEFVVNVAEIFPGLGHAGFFRRDFFKELERAGIILFVITYLPYPEIYFRAIVRPAGKRL